MHTLWLILVVALGCAANRPCEEEGTLRAIDGMCYPENLGDEADADSDADADADADADGDADADADGDTGGNGGG